MKLGKTVAANLRRLRTKRGLSQEALAHEAGINRNYVGMIERLKHSPTIDMIERLAEVLEVDPAELLRKERILPKRGS